MGGATVFLALGANLGDRRRNIEQALERLAGLPGVDVVAVSALIETAPVGGPPGQPPYLNGVARLQASVPARALLALCKELEAQAGRDPAAERDAPRPLDLDLLLYGDSVLDTRDLVLPHPRMFARDFVLGPLTELIGADAVAALPRPQRPRIVRTPAELAGVHTGWLQGGCVTGLVPTMGALHAGHAALVEQARRECDRVTVSIFVNPMQFAAGEDLDAYPRTLAADLELLVAAEVDAVYLPEAAALYPEGFSSGVEPGDEARELEGASRPTHFRGVTTVVAKLFNAARPARAYFGQKDAQQCAVLKRMVRDLDYPIELRICPIVREPDGLALSSRNVNLTPEDRSAATALYRALCAARAAHAAGTRDAGALLAAARAVLDAEPRVRVDYLELRRADDLLPLPPGPVEAGRLLVAAFLDGGAAPVRLIDNMAVSPDD